MRQNEELVLSIDTATSVAVGLARGSDVLATGVVDDSRAHVEQLTPTVTTVLAEAGVDLGAVARIVIGLGPGPFTGLRVGIVTGQVLASTTGKPWHGVCTLDVLAAQWGHSAPEAFVVATDARRKELYWARYETREGVPVRVDGPHVSAPDVLPELPVIGPGVEQYRSVLGERAVDGPTTLDPGTMAVVGSALPDAGGEPLYLRRPDAKEPGPRKSALAAGGPKRLRGLTRRTGAAGSESH
ncbi:tRNA (adenosine(37)-N6)-threonylcarbamoyltransferase complex dimerization subunit type 1 TsaB [Propionibacteriaceae bacterium Y1700]|uniref:tRNA (adenosine(37)-N6)-threonylcarbamoyltransferase complex dimerization subunit type 1 TsaB n=1 Tax=Microlunatus sp. Y1700 TaxID=3418487 RepID=UPI003DA700E0